MRINILTSLTTVQVVIVYFAIIIISVLVCVQFCLMFTAKTGKIAMYVLIGESLPSYKC